MVCRDLKWPRSFEQSEYRRIRCSRMRSVYHLHSHSNVLQLPCHPSTDSFGSPEV